MNFVKYGQNVTVNRAEGRSRDDNSKEDCGGHCGVIILMMVFEELLSHCQHGETEVPHFRPDVGDPSRQTSRLCSLFSVSGLLLGYADRFEMSVVHHDKALMKNKCKSGGHCDGLHS